MRSLNDALNSVFSKLTLIPVDYYTVLGVPQSASDTEIEAGFQAALAEIPKNRLKRMLAMLGGKSQARLMLAKTVLTDPALRRVYDEQVKWSGIFYQNPPQ